MAPTTKGDANILPICCRVEFRYNNRYFRNDHCVTTHRPRIIVRQFQVDPISANSFIMVYYSIVNVGNTDAILAFTNAQVVLLDGGAPRPAFNATLTPLGLGSLPSGGRIVGTAQGISEVTAYQSYAIAAETLRFAPSEKSPISTRWEPLAALAPIGLITFLPIRSPSPIKRMRNIKIRAPAKRRSTRQLGERRFHSEQHVPNYTTDPIDWWIGRDSNPRHRFFRCLLFLI